MILLEVLHVARERCCGSHLEVRAKYGHACCDFKDVIWTYYIVRSYFFNVFRIVKLESCDNIVEVSILLL